MQGTFLTGDGLEVDGRPLTFGTSYEQALPVVTAGLGAPTGGNDDSSPFSAYGTCPGTSLRALEFAGGAVVLLFGDVGGPGELLYAWQLRDLGDVGQAPEVRALVGDAATLEFGIGTAVADLQAGAATGTLEVFAGDEVFGPGFRLADQSAGLQGSLTATDGSVSAVTAGTACGE